MKLEQERIFSSIYSAVKDIDRLHLGRIAVSEPPVLVQRGKISKVYEEGKLFGGLEAVGDAEACLAPVPVPHVPATIPSKDFLKAAKDILGAEAELSPRYDGVQYFSPQVVLWWKRKNNEKPYDLADIYDLPFQEKMDFFSVISRKSKEAVRLITSLKSKPAIWGTWGYGTTEERLKEGLTRGGPTVREGHLHFTSFDHGEQRLAFRELPPKDKLNHYAPWDKIILKRFGISICTALSGFQPDNGPLFRVKRENKVEHHPNGAISIFNGFILDFESAVPLESVLQTLVEITGKAENTYRQIHKFFGFYHKARDDENRKRAVEEIGGVLQKIGFHSEPAQELIRFIVSIKPTYGQLLAWREEIKRQEGGERDLEQIEKNINRYERVRKRLEASNKKNSLNVAIVEDCLKKPGDSDITFTWPVHASFCYLIEDYELREEGIFVRSLHLYPEFVTTESAVERVLGVVLKRPLQSLTKTEFEQEETLRIEKSSVRQESEIWIMNGYFYKKMYPSEIEAYQVLSRHQKQLLENAGIMIPDFYGQATQEELGQLRTVYKDADRTPSENLYKISMLTGVKHRHIDESYGLGIHSTPEDFERIFQSLALFREVVRPDRLVFPEGYELFPVGLLKDTKKVIDSFLELGIDSNILFNMLEESGKFLTPSTLRVAHRDLNWNNMGISEISGDERTVLQIVDWGSFGWAHAGYDEGRLFTRFCLNQDLQRVYLESLMNFVDSNFGPEVSRKFLVSFWSTVAIRSYREIFLALTGRYQRPINYKYELDQDRATFYKEFIASFEIMLKAAMENLAVLLFN